MSDVEHPSENNGGEAGKGKPGLPARNMADIARMFLDGARPVGPARTPPGPARGAPMKYGSMPAEKPAERNGRRSVAATAPVMLGLAAGTDESAAWKLLLEAARGLAEEQATTVAIVGMLGKGSKRTFVTDVVGVESVEELPVIRAVSDAPAQGGGIADLQIARALHRLRPAVGLWVVAAPEPDSRAFPAIASIVQEWLLACPTDNSGLVAGYQHLKRAWLRRTESAASAPTVYLLSEDYAHAALVHKRLRQAAQEFLKTDLALAGAGPVRGRIGNAGHEPLRVLTIASDGPEDALWAAVLDELCPMSEQEERVAEHDVETALEQVEGHAAQLARQSVGASAMVLDHLTQVLDPEERAALAMGFDEPEESDEGGEVLARTLAAPASPVVHNGHAGRELSEMRTVKAPPVEASRAPEARATPVAKTLPREAPPVELPELVPETVVPPAPMPVPGTNNRQIVGEGITLRAFDLETLRDRKAQWQAVERSIWDLSPRSALLEARPPMSWATETCISIDAEGRLNVWTLYKDGASWFALREWASEHRNLLALTRRDLKIDKESEVAVHIVLPLEGEAESTPRGKGQDVISMMLRTPVHHVHLYRLRQVQWHDRRGMLVVPIS